MTESRGRGRGRGRGSIQSADTPERHTFSTITKSELEELYKCKYTRKEVSLVGRPPSGSSRALLLRLLGGDELKSKYVKEVYSALFSETLPTLPDDLPPLLGPLLEYISAVRSQGINPLSNGSGKLFVFRLLQLLPQVARWVRISTTNNPTTDWCGINTPQLSGVVDVAVVKGGVWGLVGEVKGGHESPFVQIVSAMQAIKKRDGDWPCGKSFLRCYILNTKVFYFPISRFYD